LSPSIYDGTFGSRCHTIISLLVYHTPCWPRSFHEAFERRDVRSDCAMNKDT
jgi:hypothetical protein